LGFIFYRAIQPRSCPPVEKNRREPSRVV
jgi:hypothetical protein